MYRVLKELDFCYGHRLLDYAGKCRHPHGHNGTVEIELESDTLDSRGMVMDFDDIKKAVLEWIDNNLDHKMLLSRRDPMLPAFQKAGEPVYIFEGNPTAENIARVICEQACSQGFPVVRVTVWETPRSSATYRP